MLKSYGTSLGRNSHEMAVPGNSIITPMNGLQWILDDVQWK